MDQYHYSTAIKECIPCTDTNCRLCDQDPGICEECMPTYLLLTTVCVTPAQCSAMEHEILTSLQQC